MNKELILSVVVAVVGTLGAYFACNLFIGDIKSETVNTIDNSVTADLASPDIEVFNYEALNPTVETYIGECSEYNEYGECIDDDNAVNIQTDADGNIVDVNTNGNGTINIDIDANATPDSTNSSGTNSANSNSTNGNSTNNNSTNSRSSTNTGGSTKSSTNTPSAAGNN